MPPLLHRSNYPPPSILSILAGNISCPQWYLTPLSCRMQTLRLWRTAPDESAALLTERSAGRATPARCRSRSESTNPSRRRWLASQLRLKRQQRYLSRGRDSITTTDGSSASTSNRGSRMLGLPSTTSKGLSRRRQRSTWLRQLWAQCKRLL